MELLARSGFLSLVNLSTYMEGMLKTKASLPQQPTENLMVSMNPLIFVVLLCVLNDALQQDLPGYPEQTHQGRPGDQE